MKTDRPIPAKIILNLIDKKSTGEEFIGLSGTLYQQNLIFSEPRELKKKRNHIELTVIFRDKLSFNNWINNKEIKKYWLPIFKNNLSNNPKTIKETDVIIEIENVKNCT